MNGLEKKEKHRELVSKGLCLGCENPVGNNVFTVCDNCWDTYKPDPV